MQMLCNLLRAAALGAGVHLGGSNFITHSCGGCFDDGGEHGLGTFAIDAARVRKRDLDYVGGLIFTLSLTVFALECFEILRLEAGVCFATRLL